MRRWGLLGIAVLSLASLAATGFAPGRTSSPGPAGGRVNRAPSSWRPVAAAVRAKAGRTAVTGQELAATHATALQAAGITGAGIKIAVIDIGFGGYQSAVASGELPDSTNLDPNGCADSTASSHGTAVAEILHEMAPDAALNLICADSEATLSTAVDWAINQRIPLINHSVTWLNGGRGDGVTNRTDRPSPDAIARKAFSNGILWVNAAGNYGQSHWSGPWNDPDRDHWENFAGADEGNSFTIPAGESSCAALSWDDWPLSEQDFDLYLFKEGGAKVSPLASSTNPQGPGAEGAPAEDACYRNTGSRPLQVYAAIKANGSATTNRFDLFVTDGALQYDVSRGSIGEPAESPWTLAVGTVCWKNNEFRPYSSEGPTIDGRIKPDLVGYDSISTSTFGVSTGCDGGFEGTSAATPEVTGAAALLFQQRPELIWNPTAAMGVLEAKTVDIGLRGRDDAFGSGALCLSDCSAPPPPPPPPPPPSGSLALQKFSTVPKRSRAGRVFVARIAVVLAGTKTPVTQGRVLCSASVGGKRLRTTSAQFRGPLARCAWRIPASARRKLLRGSVGVAYRGATIRRAFRQRIA